MKLILHSLALLVLLAYLAETKITFSPFSISFGRGWQMLGIILIVCGCICLKAQWYSEGLTRGAEIKKEVIEEVKEEIKNEIKSSL